MNARSNDISTLLNVNNSQFRNCDFEAGTYQSMINGQPVSLVGGGIIELNAGDTLVLNGNIADLHIKANGGTLHLANGTTATGLNISGNKLIFEAGQSVSVDRLNGEGAQFIDFRCGENVRFTNSSFEAALFSMCSEMGSGTSFENCNFQGCHLNCSLAEASLIGCTVSESTRLAEAELERCTVRDLKLVKEDGTSQFIANLEQLKDNGVTSTANTQLSDGARIQTAMASVTGGQDCAEASFQANLPNEAQKSADIARHS